MYRSRTATCRGDAAKRRPNRAQGGAAPPWVRMLAAPVLATLKGLSRRRRGASFWIRSQTMNKWKTKIDATLSPGRVSALLYELCVKYGYCEASWSIDQLAQNPP